MLQLSAKLYNVPILSLRTMGPVGTAISPIINPNNLKIEGWHAADKFSGERLVLPANEVREFMPDGLAVNDHDAMTDPSEMVRLQKVIKINFELKGKLVMTENLHKLGKVSDFAFDVASMFIQKLYVTPRGFKALASDDFLIGRTQIVKITDKAVVVRDPDIKEPAESKVPVPAEVALP